MYFDFRNSLYALESYGLMDVVVPFILIFTVSFAMLKKAKIFGDDSKKFNIVISLSLTLTTIIPHVLNIYPYDYDVVRIINTALPSVALWLVGILCFFMLVGMFGKAPTLGDNSISGFIAIGAFVVVFLIFLSAAGIISLDGFLYFLNDPDVQAFIIVVAVFFGIIKMVTGEDEDPNNEGISKVISKLFQ